MSFTIFTVLLQHSSGICHIKEEYLPSYHAKRGTFPHTSISTSISITMPWLSRRNSAEVGTKHVNDDLKRNDKHPVSSIVNFIPAQLDGLCGTMPTHHKQAASRLLWGDLRVLFQNLGCLPAMAKSTCSTKVLRNLFKHPVDARDTILEAFLAIVQIWLLATALPAFVSLPGLLFAGFMNSVWLLTLAMIWPLSGPRVFVKEREKAPMTNGFSDERWIYVNGMMCR